MLKDLLVKISPGELLDKLTILEIKMSKISDKAKIINIQTEYQSLLETWETQIQNSEELNLLRSELKLINEKLWQIEDDIRMCERNSDFGPSFIELARSVYFKNDKRAQLKRQINELLDSELVEEKSYASY